MKRKCTNKIKKIKIKKGKKKEKNKPTMTETNRLYKNRDKNYIKKGLLMKRSIIQKNEYIIQKNKYIIQKNEKKQIVFLKEKYK